MGKHFGTDGVRGIANKDLTPELAFKLGRVGGYVLTKDKENPRIMIGRDTRISGTMLESALISGLLSIGAEVMRLGVISTPGVAYLTKSLSAHGGIMISASHNPVEDNGIKFFSVDGFKLSDEQELEIETVMEMEEDQLPRPIGTEVGVVNDYLEGGQKYLAFLKDTIDNEFPGMQIAIDCAHGSTSGLATHLFADLDAEIYSIGSSPNGININDGVGSTNPEALQAFVREKGVDVGLAFDGDGDRLIATDEKGNIVDGDQIMFICAKHMNEKGILRKNTVVSTVMSNIGLYKALEENGVHSEKTAVGDRHVMEEMRKGDYNLGGEQSGHIIFLDYNTTGDGMLTAVQLLNVMKETNKPLSELAAEMKVYPQVLKNIKVLNKQEVKENPTITNEIEKANNELGNEGRIFVRPSGTEPLVRVMVEAPTKERCETYADRIVHVIKEALEITDE